MPLATPDFEFLQHLVAKRSGNVIAPRQQQMVEQRLQKVLVSTGLDDVNTLMTELKGTRGHTLQDRVAEAITVNETSFFRDAHLFQAMRTYFIPEAMQRNAATRTIRIWCAAGSSGQEPYSIAMVLRDHFPQLDRWNVDILVTDLSEEMLERSRNGIYSQLEVNRGLPAKDLVRFFDRKGSRWQVKSELRSMLRHQRLNLIDPFPPISAVDIVLIRNVLIYFDQPTRQSILSRIGKVLTPDGHLFIGSAETMIGMNLPYERKVIDGTVCYQTQR